MLALACLLLLNSIGQISAAVIPSSVGSWAYQGCFVDNSVRQLQHQQFVSGGMTVEACTTACTTAGFQLAGLEFGGECWCDSFMKGTKLVSDADCQNMVCSGNSAEYCGASSRLQVYLDTSAPAPDTTVCVTNSHQNFVPIAVTKDASATQFALNAVQAGIGPGNNPSFLISADGCGSPCNAQGSVSSGDVFISVTINGFLNFAEFTTTATGESPFGYVNFTPPGTVYCVEINPVAGRIGPLVLAANAHSDLWALCPNTTITPNHRDLVYSPVENHPHYSLSACVPVWFTLAYWQDPHES
ncbi:WSC domain-containing protein [Mycena floridula]|nr:WSC domain-containing protein [Mycena floridula]KAJ7592867.1 WSC domain-containing protein [Mycena floridula]